MATLDELISLALPAVTGAINELDEGERVKTLNELAAALFELAVEDIGAELENPDSARDGFVASMSHATGKTAASNSGEDTSDADRVARVYAKAAMGAAQVAAAPTATRTWVTQEDDRVRETHVPMHGVTADAGAPFDVGGFPLYYPGQPVGPPEVWINCRCEMDFGAAVTAAAGPYDSVVVVAVPSDAELLALPGGELASDLHVTLGYYGKASEADPALRTALEGWVDSNQRSEIMTATVGGRGALGTDDPQASVLLLESPVLAEWRRSLEATAPPDATHPHFTPHMTMGYGVDIPPEAVPASVNLDRVELWWAGERYGRPVVDAREQGDLPDDIVARAFSGDERKKLADKGQAMDDGSFPIANEQDLRNAIQAVGRAKDPAKARAHIRKRAKALGKTDLIPDSWVASVEEELVAAPGTHDGPGWLTHPRDTQRLRDYWARGTGAAKIRWGTPGDLTRCHRHLEKYVGPYAWGTCQNLHKTALGIYNPESRGRRGGGDPDEMIDMIDAAFMAAATLEELMLPPRSFFEDPHLDGPTPQTIRAAGDFTEYVGHLATWDTCHVGMQGGCTNAPRSATNYAHFRVGEVETDGGMVPVGHITAGTGHAGTDLGPSETVRHYDDTGTVVADVAVGEDEFGIWAHGIARPGINDDQLYALRAGAPSGDWRRIGGNLELVGALIVNVPGFPIPRAELAASADGRDLALVAAAMVVADPNALDADRIAIAIERRMEERAAARDRAQRAAALRASVNPQRVATLLDCIGA